MWRWRNPGSLTRQYKDRVVHAHLDARASKPGERLARRLNLV